jgi:hypothetical protein
MGINVTVHQDENEYTGGSEKSCLSVIEQDIMNFGCHYCNVTVLPRMVLICALCHVFTVVPFFMETAE